MRRLLLAALATVSLAAGLGVPASAAAASSPRVAIIVGPVGALTDTYLHLAELAASEALRRGATVVRAYSPNATPGNVLAAVEGANMVIYFGHGYGHPSPYGGLNTARQNGWGLQGPAARGTHADGLNGELAYYGEDWIVANARPAPGFVMIYSNVCYAPGASEGNAPVADEGTALSRVAHYSRKVFRMGGSAYFATDFDRGAADLVGRLLDHRHAAYGWQFAADHRYVPSALRAHGHPFAAGQQVWLHRSKYTDGPANWWYAFAGNPDATLARSWDPIAPSATLVGERSRLSTDATVSLRLSEPVSGVEAALRLLDAAGRPVPAEVTVSPDGRRVRVDPTHPLALSASYRLQLDAGLADAAGNPLPADAWNLGTRLDADPLDGPMPITLEAGAHTLVRLDPFGAVVERRRLVVAEDRLAVATARARLPGRAGAWLELGGRDLAEWWVAESPLAHAVGRLDEAIFRPAAQVELAAGRHTLERLDDAGRHADGELVLREARPVRVDRRVVVDGALLVRMARAEGRAAGRWLAIDPSVAPAEPSAQRHVSTEGDTVATIELAPGRWTLVRFDARGRVIDRRSVDGAAAGALVADRVLTVGTARFHRVVGGDLDGWAVRENPAHRTVTHEDGTDSAE